MTGPALLEGVDPNPGVPLTPTRLQVTGPALLEGVDPNTGVPLNPTRLQVTGPALLEIARRAAQQQSGARGLVTVRERQ